METLRTETVHTTDSIHSTLSCINVQDIKETSKENEEEGLLYGADEDDALSDDSLRLRVSDDEEIEAEDAVTSIKVMNEDNKPKSSMTGIVPGNSGPGIELKRDPSESKEAVIKNGVSTSEIPDKEGRESGNIPLNETTMSESPRNRNTSEGRPYGSAVGRQFPVPRAKVHDNRRRFLPTSRIRPYRPENRISYMRSNYYAQNELYRATPENYWNNPRNYSGFHGSVFSHKYGRYSGIGHDAWPSYSSKRPMECNRKDPPKDSAMSSTNIGQSKTKETELAEHAEQEEIKDAKIVDEACKVSDVAENTVDTEAEVETNNDAHEDKKHITISSTEKTVDEINNATDKWSEDHEGKNIEEYPEECTSISRNNDELSIALQEEKSNDNDEEDKIKDVDESLDQSTELPQNHDVDFTVTNVDAECKNNDEEKNNLGTDNTQLADTTELNDDSKTEKTEIGSITEQSDQKENCLQLEEKQENSINEKTEKVDAENDEETTVISIEVSPEKEKVINVENDLEKEKDDPQSHQVSDVEQSASNETEVSSNAIKSSKSNITDDDSSFSGEADEPKSILRKQSKRSSLTKRTVSKETTLKVFNVDSDTTDNLTSTDDSSSVSKDKTLPSATGERKSSDNEKKRTEESIAPQRRRRRTKRMTIAAQEAAIMQETQVLGLENGRQKRRTAKNAAEIIRKRFLNLDSDLESSDGSDKFVMVNPKSQFNDNARSLSPPSLKRPCLEITSVTANGSLKKAKIMSDEVNKETRPLSNNMEKIKNLSYARKFFQRDFNGRIQKLKPEELEELLIQMIAEVITNRSEMGKLREQARVSVRNQETLRTRCQQLAKQIKDMEMVLNRNAADRRANNEKPMAPIKINRSVGLQVNITSSEYGIQNLRQIQNNAGSKTIHITNNLNTSTTEVNSNNTTPRRGLKVRSPRRSDSSVGPQATTQNQIPTSPLTSAVTPTALVVTKPVESQQTATPPNQTNNVQKMLPVQQPQTVIVNGKIPNQNNRQSTSALTLKTTANDLIDLTDEEEKSKLTSPENPVTILPIPTGHMKPQQSPTQTPPQSCYQRVIQTIPASVAITNQSSIRVVQPAVQPTPTALVNNMNAPRVAYVMQGNGPPRQLLIASNSNPIRPATSCRPPFTTVTYKTGIQTVANGTVRVLTTPATPNIQPQKHPAPLPETPTYMVNPAWKLPPPAPSLKISKHSNGTQKGIVLSWNMALTDKHAEIASYQLYAYQEIPGMLPSTSLWKKVGDVRALPLPMACTLTQFSESNNYYFAVRAVDTHSRKGQYSFPGNISL